MNKKIITLIIVLIIIAIAVIVYASTGALPPTQEAQDKKGPANTEQLRNDQEDSKPATTSQEPPHPVSIQALSQKEYDGRDFTIGKVLEENTAYTRHYITYKSGELTISGIMNTPKGSGPFPVLFLNHGYIDPAIYTNGRGLRREQDFLARQGYIVIHSDYRNHAQSSKDPNSEINIRLGYVEDVINGIYALKNAQLPYADTNRIGMLGHSMGGGVSLNVMVAKPELVDAFVLYAPVSANFEDNFERWTKSRPEIANKIIELYGSPSENPDFWKNVSPQNFLEKVQAPVFIFHGTNDSSVPYEWSTRLEQNLKNQNKNVSLTTYAGEAHEFAPQWNNFMTQSSAFFKQNLK